MIYKIVKICKECNKNKLSSKNNTGTCWECTTTKLKKCNNDDCNCLTKYDRKFCDKCYDIFKRNLRVGISCSEESKNKISQTLIRKYSSGEIKQWCKDKTKDNDERIAKFSEKSKKTRKERGSQSGKNNPMFGHDDKE